MQKSYEGIRISLIRFDRQESSNPKSSHKVQKKFRRIVLQKVAMNKKEKRLNHYKIDIHTKGSF